MRKSPAYTREIAGQQFNHWLALERNGRTKAGRILYKCRCVCGVEKNIDKQALMHGQSKSCGCVTKPKRQLGEKYAKPWTEEDEQRIRDWYPVNGTLHLSKFLGRSKNAIIAKAKKLGVSFNKRNMVRRHDVWQPSELKVLREHYPTGGALGCLDYLPNRSKNAIWGKAEKLGLHKIKEREAA